MATRQLEQARPRAVPADGRFDPGPRFLVDLAAHLWARRGRVAHVAVLGAVALALALARSLG